MFADLTAWFSSSIGQRKKQKWFDNGGKEAELDDAEFIFSADAGCEDTERIFASEPYQDELLAVFHPNYIDECIKLGGPKAGVLGKYFLPPKDVQKLIRAQMSLQWDVDGHTSDSDSPIKVGAKQSTQPKQGPSRNNTNNAVQNGQSVNTQNPQPGPSKLPAIRDVTGQTKPENQAITGQTAEQTQNKTKRARKSSVQKEEEQEYLRLEDLAKSTGELMDFVPGKGGCDMINK